LKKTVATIRIFYQNLDGIPQEMDSNVKLQSIRQWLQLIEADVFAFLGTCWDVIKYEHVGGYCQHSLQVLEEPKTDQEKFQS